MIGVHAQVAPLRELGLVARTLDLLLPEAVGGAELGLEFLLHRQCDVDALERQAREHELADGAVDLRPRHPQANRDGLLDALLLTHVLGPQASVSRLVADGHASPTPPTEDQPLEQRRALARRTLAAVQATGLGVHAELPLMAFVVLPRDVADMCGRQKGVPLLTRSCLNDAVAVHGLARPTAAVDEHPGVARIV